MTDQEVLDNIPEFPQTQCSLDEQLRLLRVVANKIGCYDAADFLADYIRSRGL